MDFLITPQFSEHLLLLLHAKFPRLGHGVLEDTMQDALIIFWTSAPQHVKDSGPRARSWIKTVAIWLAIRQYKRERLRVSIESVESQVSRPVVTPQELLVDRVTMEQLLARVTGTDRLCLRLRLEGYTYQEIAERVPPPASTHAIEVRMARLIRKMKIENSM
jgi:RNA polymerase sigma factor (sigma-70 family)